MRKFRRHTKIEREKEKEQEREKEKERDRISELPEPIIHHIFSFLPYKSVVATSILSPKWRYLWTSNPTIDFRNWRSPSTWICQKETNAFMNLLDRVLSNRQDVHSPPIKKFRLYYDVSFRKTKVHEWISIVLRHKVEEIALKDHYGVMFPPSLFTCESLTMLEISKAFFEFPDSINFPKLKILRLKTILQNEQLIQKFLSNSPMLEELNLKVCDWKIQHLRICGPSLKRLFIIGSLYRNFDIQIDAPNLQSFKYSKVLAKDFILHNFLTLLDADIVLSRPADSEKRGELGYFATKLFSSLAYVNRLTVSDYSLKLLSYEDNFPAKLPSFNNLIQLEVISAGSYFENGCRDEGYLPCYIVGTLLNFLHITPNLESLIFAEGLCKYESDNNDGLSLDFVPQCLLLHLKSIEFRGFFASMEKIEMDLLKLFLKNAKVLHSKS